jgi:hypothetical protein
MNPPIRVSCQTTAAALQSRKLYYAEFTKNCNSTVKQYSANGRSLSDQAGFGTGSYKIQDRMLFVPASERMLSAREWMPPGCVLVIHSQEIWQAAA